MIAILTSNPRKFEEYQAFLSKYGKKCLMCQPDSVISPLEEIDYVMRGESNIVCPKGDVVQEGYVGLAYNVCQLRVWGSDSDPEVFTARIPGYYNAQSQSDSDVWDWDAAFHPREFSYHDMRDLGLKCSARQEALSSFAEANLVKDRRTLRHIDAESPLNSHLFQGLPERLENIFNSALNTGIPFRAVRSKREGIYWWPGLNAGIPWTPKSSAVHEATFLFHDLVHQLIPDLVWDAGVIPDLKHRRAYIAYRLLSEAVSLVISDMLYTDHLVQEGVDVRETPVHPLYEVMQDKSLPALIDAMGRYVLLGNPSGFPTGTKEWRAFQKKFSRFFVGDFEWTRRNFEKISENRLVLDEWSKELGRGPFQKIGLTFLSDEASDLPDDLGLMVTELIRSVTDRIETIASQKTSFSPEEARKKAFRRWLTGQYALFVSYRPLVGHLPEGQEILLALKGEINDQDHLKDVHDQGIERLWREKTLSTADWKTYQEVYPLIKPFFLKDYDNSKQEFESVVEASKEALKW